MIRLELWLQKWHEEAFVGNESESARTNRTYSTYSREANLLCIDGGVGEPNTLLPVHSRKTVHEVWNAWNSRWNITWRWFVAWSRELDGVGVTETTGACRQDAHWSVMYHGSMWWSLPLVVWAPPQDYSSTARPDTRSSIDTAWIGYGVWMSEVGYTVSVRTNKQFRNPRDVGKSFRNWKPGKLFRLRPLYSCLNPTLLTKPYG